LAQTLVRFAAIGHGPANAVMLPHTLDALATRAPAAIERLGDALADRPEAFAARLAAIAGAERLRDLGVSEGQLAQCAEEASTRPELALTPPVADRAELLGLYRAAY